MAKLNEGFSFTGSVGNLSVYKMKGIDRLVVRQKGGPSKEKIKGDANFEITRRKNSEFGGRASITKWIMRALLYHKPIADFNIAGPLNALMIPIQQLDDKNIMGQREVRLSSNPEILKGFSLNRNNPFDSIIRTPIEFGFAGLAAWVNMPALLPGINLYPSTKHPWFRVVVTLGLVPDMLFMMDRQPIEPDYDSFTEPQAKAHNFSYSYSHPGYQSFDGGVVENITPWYPVKKGMAATTLPVAIPTPPPNEDYTLLLSIGVQYGFQEETNTISQVPYAGAAKILAVK